MFAFHGYTHPREGFGAARFSAFTFGRRFRTLPGRSTVRRPRPLPGRRPAPLSPRGVVGALRSLAWRVQRARRDRNLHFSERRGVFLHVLTSHLVKGLAYCFKLGCWLIEFFFFLNAGEVFQQTCFMTISD